MVSKLTQNLGIDYAVLSKNVSNRLPELLADGANIIITEDIDISVLTSKFDKPSFKHYWMYLVFIIIFNCFYMCRVHDYNFYNLSVVL